VKPKTEQPTAIKVPFVRNDDFNAGSLQPVWQWNHVPDDTAWSLKERAGYLRLHALPATSLWDARNTLTQRAIGPRSTPTVILDTSSMKDHDVAGLALFSRPYAWIGVERANGKVSLTQFDEQTNKRARVELEKDRVWLRAECDFLSERARFSYSTDGRKFIDFGEPFTMVFQLTTFQGVRYSLFSYNSSGARGGAADFDAFTVDQPSPRGLMREIPYGAHVQFVAAGESYGLNVERDQLRADVPSSFEVIDRHLGRVALRSQDLFLSVDTNGDAVLSRASPYEAQAFQWIETPTGELVLMSLRTHRFLRIDPQTKHVVADSPGPRPDNADGTRFLWSRVAETAKQ
jgi:hypothetical protein